MASSLLEKNKEFILFLNKLSKPDRAKILHALGPSYINTIAEIFSNFLQENLTTNLEAIEEVKKYKKEVRAIARKRLPTYLKKRLLVSKKGRAILSVLLPIAASLIGSLIGSK